MKTLIKILCLSVLGLFTVGCELPGPDSGDYDPWKTVWLIECNDGSVIYNTENDWPNQYWETQDECQEDNQLSPECICVETGW